MCLVHVAALAAHELEHLLRVRRAVHLPVFRMLHLERRAGGFRPAHEPVHRFRKHDRPMAAEMNVRFLRGNQQKLRIGLGLERLEVGVQLVEAEIREVGGMSVAVEVHDHRRVDPHGFHDRLEWRRPFWAVRHRLHGVGEMPVRAQRLVSGERGEAIAIRVAQDVRQRCFRCALGDEKKHAHALGTSGRRIHPRVVLPILVAQLPHADADAASPRSVPEVREVRGKIARKEILVRRRKHGDAAAGGFRRERSVAHLDRLALCAESRAVDRLQRARRVVIRNLGAHVVPGRAIGRRSHVEPGVVVVGDVGLVGREHRFLLNQPASGIERVRRPRPRSCPCACRRTRARRARRCCEPWRPAR